MDINEISLYDSKANNNNSVMAGLVPQGQAKAGNGVRETGSVTASDAFLVNLQREGQSPASAVYTDTDENGGSAGVLESGEQAKQDLALLNGEDYESIEEEEGSFSKSNQAAVERAVERAKEKKEWEAEIFLKNARIRELLQDGIEKIQQSGFLEQKSLGQLRELFEENGFPVSEETIRNMINAMGMGQTAAQVTDQSMEYMIGQNLEPTIENLYHGKFSAQETGWHSSGGAQDFAQYQQQIEKILADCGKADNLHREEAEWLFQRELPVNNETLEQMDLLQEIREQTTPEKLLEQILFAVARGVSPTAANLDDTCYQSAKDAVEGFQEITGETVGAVAGALDGGELALEDVTLELLRETQKDPGKKILPEQEPAEENAGRQRYGEAAGTEEGRSGTVVSAEEKAPADSIRGTEPENEAYAAAAAEERQRDGFPADMEKRVIHEVTLHRMLEEIRQKMTLQVAVSMERRGIHIETESLETVINSLREKENEYYAAQSAASGEAAEPEQLDLLQETLAKTNDISRAHASVLGTGIRQQQLLTLNEIHAAVNSQTAERNIWNETYEAVGTQVRSDLGDSIQKAFQGIPDLLKSLGMEDTQANERAVRILGYNSMEITEEAVKEVKYFDEKVNHILDSMRPATVLELIRKGVNPLNVPLEELQAELDRINEENGITDGEKYSRFLWQLEKNGQITEDERAGYIGVFRLLRQIERSDGAVIGAALEVNQELTLGNLLTQARIRKSKGIDARVDEKTGFSQAVKTKASITDQISQGFSEKEYYSGIASQALRELTPSKLLEISDGDFTALLETSLEKFCEEIRHAAGDKKAGREYYEEQAKELRETLLHSEEAQEYLGHLQIEDTLENVVAAKAMIEGNMIPYKEFYSRKKSLSEEQEEELEELFDGFEEEPDTEEELNLQCEKAENFMKEVLTKSKERADITFEDLRTLSKLGQGLRLQGLFRQSKSYEIPIRTGDSVTALNLTLIHGGDESGKIQISMEDEKYGAVSMEFKLSGRSVKGLVLCGQRQGFELLRERGFRLEENIENAGYQVKNISYGMDFRARNELLNEEVPQEGADTERMYQFAKIAVRWTIEAIREE